MLLYICSDCGVQIEAEEPLARCKCGGTMHRQVYPELLTPEEVDDLHGEYDYDPETGMELTQP